MRRTTVSALAALVLGLSGASFAQFPLSPINGGATRAERAQGTEHARSDLSTIDEDIQLKQLKRLREQRLREVFSDTARLLQLATELKTQVDRANKPTPDEMKDVDEIGKLAKRVSEHIKME